MKAVRALVVALILFSAFGGMSILHGGTTPARACDEFGNCGGGYNWTLDWGILGAAYVAVTGYIVYEYWTDGWGYSSYDGLGVQPGGGYW